jgi:outer membrane protein assembly factor BamB
MDKQFLRGVSTAIMLIVMLAACSPQLVPAAPTPTPEPVLPPVSQATAAPTAEAPPTATPIPLGQGASDGTALPGPPAAFLPLVGEGGTCLAAAPFNGRLPDMRFGVNIVPGAQPLDQLLDAAKNMNAGWVRATLRWSDMEPQKGAYTWDSLDALIEGARARGLRILLVVTGAPTWANPTGGMPDQPEPFGVFMDALARHAPGQISAFEIWDAPNTAAVNGGTVADPAVYAALLKAGSDAIKAVDRCALVLNGALFPTVERDPKVAMDDLTFYRGMLKYQNGAARKAYDILATQINTSGMPANTGWKFGQQNESVKYYGHVTLLRDEMTADGEGNKHLWITAIGYQTAGDQAVDPAQQSTYLQGVFDRSETFYPWISGIFVRDLGGASATLSYDLLNADGSPRPAYGALSSYFAKQKVARTRDVTFPDTGLTMLWEQGFPATNQLVLAPDGAIYGGNGRGFVNGIDATGAFRRNERISSHQVRGIAFDPQGNIYMAASDGVLVSSTAGGELRWSALIKGAAATPLLVSADGQTLYAGTGGEQLAAFSTRDGSQLWSTALGGGIPGAPALGEDGTVYIGTTEGTLFAVAPDGSVRWRYNAGGWVRTAPTVRGGVVYAATDGGALVALNGDGSQRWRVELGQQQATGVARASDGLLFVALADGTLHAVSADGAQAWSKPLGKGRPTAPVIGPNGRIFVGADSGNLYAVTPDGATVNTFEFHDKIGAAPLVGLDGAVYVSLDGKDDQDHLVAFGPPDLRERYRLS